MLVDQTILVSKRFHHLRQKVHPVQWPFFSRLFVFPPLFGTRVCAAPLTFLCEVRVASACRVGRIGATHLTVPRASLAQAQESHESNTPVLTLRKFRFCHVISGLILTSQSAFFSFPNSFIYWIQNFQWELTILYGTWSKKIFLVYKTCKSRSNCPECEKKLNRW